MIKFRATGPQDSLILGFGLSRENVNHLIAGEPIRIQTAELGLAPGSIYIFFGETEAAMAADLQEFLGPETQIHGM